MKIYNVICNYNYIIIYINNIIIRMYQQCWRELHYKISTPPTYLILLRGTRGLRYTRRNECVRGKKLHAVSTKTAATSLCPLIFATTPRENREKCLAKFRPQARQVSDMNFLGRSLIDVSGVAVVCSPFFFRNNEPRRRERPVNSPQVAERPVYNDGSSVRRNLRARTGGKKEKYRNSRCPEN